MTGLIGGSFGYGSSSIPRLELALPGLSICPAPQYNPNITFHGLFTIPFMIMPITIGGFGNLSSPSSPRPSDMIFPRLNAFNGIPRISSPSHLNVHSIVAVLINN